MGVPRNEYVGLESANNDVPPLFQMPGAAPVGNSQPEVYHATLQLNLQCCQYG